MKARVVLSVFCVLLLFLGAYPWAAAQVEAPLGSMAKACLAELPSGQIGQEMLAFFAQTEEWLPEGLVFEAESWEESAGWRALAVRLRMEEGGALPLFVIRFSQADQDLRLPEAEIRRALADEAYLRALMECHALGIPLGLEGYEQAATEGGMIAFLLTAYEALAGGDIQTDGIVLWPETPVEGRKALAIGLLETGESWRPQQRLEPLRVVELWTRWFKAVTDQVGRRGAEPLLEEDFVFLLDAVARMTGSSGLEAGEALRLPLDRERYARLALPVFLAAYGGQIELENLWLPELDDTDDVVLRQAVALSIIDAVTPPDTEWTLFEQERELTVFEGYDLLAQWVCAGFAYQEIPLPLTWEVLLPKLQRLLACGRSMSASPNARQIVENDRPYPWYLRQEETGSYSANNCMPAATAMALRWVNEENDVSVEQMRDLAPMQGMGWYPQQVMDIFAEYHVDYATPPISLSGMTEALDAGHILFVLLNEGAYGHCLIVKGYVREGGGLWMVTYDPASPERDAWGQYIGRNRRIEAGALIRAMENHWWLYFDIAGEAVD